MTLSKRAVRQSCLLEWTNDSLLCRTTSRELYTTGNHTANCFILDKRFDETTEELKCKHILTVKLKTAR
jgi:hypothetical protein